MLRPRPRQMWILWHNVSPISCTIFGSCPSNARRSSRWRVCLNLRSGCLRQDQGPSESCVSIGTLFRYDCWKHVCSWCIRIFSRYHRFLFRMFRGILCYLVLSMQKTAYFVRTRNICVFWFRITGTHIIMILTMQFKYLWTCTINYDITRNNGIKFMLVRVKSDNYYWFNIHPRSYYTYANLFCFYS